jgi:hypothetical protein
LFDDYTQATEQVTTICDDDNEEFEEDDDILGLDDVVVPGAGVCVGKKEGERHRTTTSLTRRTSCSALHCCASAKTICGA